MGPAAPGRLLLCQTTASARWGLPMGAALQVRTHATAPQWAALVPSLSYLQFCGDWARLHGRDGLTEAALSQLLPCSGWSLCQREEPVSV